MKEKISTPLTPIAHLKPDLSTEAKPTKSLRPQRSMLGLKSMRPKQLPVVALRPEGQLKQ